MRTQWRDPQIEPNPGKPSETTTYPVHILIETTRSKEWVGDNSEYPYAIRSEGSIRLHAFTERYNVPTTDAINAIRQRITLEDDDVTVDPVEVNVEVNVEVETLDSSKWSSTDRIKPPVGHIEFDPDEDDVTWTITHDHPLVADDA